MTYIEDESNDKPDTELVPSSLNAGRLDITNYPLEIVVQNIDQFVNEDYALLRKNGLGTSDASALLGVNPFTSREELIAEKVRNYITEEEKGIGDLTNVRKGRDLEPLIIQKHEKYMSSTIIKPIDMYRHKEFPYLTINFDGVTGTPEQYIPDEIKVVTMYGEKYYDRTKAFFNEKTGFTQILEDPSQHNWSIETKAAYYGIPPYYYTQLQQQILGLNAPFGYLSVLFDKSWDLYSFYIWRDDKVISALITEGYKVWQKILERRGPTWELKRGMDLISTEQ